MSGILRPSLLSGWSMSGSSEPKVVAATIGTSKPARYMTMSISAPVANRVQEDGQKGDLAKQPFSRTDDKDHRPEKKSRNGNAVEPKHPPSLPLNRHS